MTNPLDDFTRWCDKPWTAACNWNKVPCVVHISRECIAQAQAAYPPGTDIAFTLCHAMAAAHYPQLKAKWRTGQIAINLPTPLAGTWHLLLYLDALYLNTQPHPIPSMPRRPSTTQ